MEISNGELISGSVTGNINYFKLIERGGGDSIIVTVTIIIVIIVALAMLLMSTR